MVRSSKILMSAVIMLMLLDIIRRKRKHDVRKVTDCLRSDSEKWDIENDQKFAFLLISTNKDSLCSGIQTYFLWNNKYLSKVLKVLAAYFHWKQNHTDFNEERYENCWCQHSPLSQLEFMSYIKLPLRWNLCLT